MSGQGLVPTAAAFVKRHVWSVSLSVLAALCFARLAHQMQAGGLDPFDRRVAVWLTSRRGEWDEPMLLLTRFGSFWSMAALCSVVVLLLCWRRRYWEAAYLAASGAGAGLWCSALKLLFQRVRPGEEALYLISTPGSFSFPSGHAMGSAGVIASFVIAVYAVRAARGWRVLAVALGLPLVLGVAASRVYFGVHYPSDILGGQLAACAWVAAVTGWFYPRLLPAEASDAE